VVTSFNAIWHGHDQALVEARGAQARWPVRPGVLGRAQAGWARPYFLTVAALIPQGQGEDFLALSRIGKPGVAEAMLQAGITRWSGA
jgi:hypothetical protein